MRSLAVACAVLLAAAHAVTQEPGARKPVVRNAAAAKTAARQASPPGTVAGGSAPRPASSNGAAPQEVRSPMTARTGFPPLKEPVTSFGAAIADGALYVYGGHRGTSHEYSVDDQSDRFRRLKLDGASDWEDLPGGPRLQGLALVAAERKLYRIGGFSARNAKGQPQDMHSTAECAMFDPQTGHWDPLPDLPAARSSHDAAVLDGRLYVVGGWTLAGSNGSTWHTTALTLDPRDSAAGWQRLPEPPFRRRALSVAAFDGKLFALGGMQPTGATTTRVDVYDPQSQRWSVGPSLVGEPLEGFGTAAFASGDHLYASTYSGMLQRLGRGAEKWEVVRTLPEARFFHRLLPLGNDRLVVLGGASMTSGKFGDVSTILLEGR